eukprot:scaffold84703_cov28-Tisochrysis_lutea.AAC.1
MSWRVQGGARARSRKSSRVADRGVWAKNGGSTVAREAEKLSREAGCMDGWEERMEYARARRARWTSTRMWASGEAHAESVQTRACAE